MTPQEVKRKLHGVPKDKQGALVCALVGHSRIVSEYWGYVYCGRCQTQVADKLGGAGYAQAKECVQIGHGCKVCRANYKRMGWKDKFLTPNPFVKRTKRQEAL